ncbi:hypothetical protein [Roseateles sp.]|uniref:hypothetical protein n=1 Tax=Roseateles sp. TaxID=1971397 RepID=UPI0025DADAC8|nr:hypothetical protein [Roseateles sp.]MBV8036987.1 hypothetical protein [Roseateles sp.]
MEEFAVLDERQAVRQQTLRHGRYRDLVKHGQDAPSSRRFSARELAPYLASNVASNDWQDDLVAAKSDKRKLFGRLQAHPHCHSACKKSIGIAVPRPAWPAPLRSIE